MPEPVPLADSLGRWQRVGVTVVGLVLVVHSVLLAMWLAPSSPVRDLVGQARLASYVDPYFQQSDQTVGVASNRVDESLSLRALVRPEGGGKPIVTDWIDVTRSETQAIRGNAGPARAHQIARRLATNVNFVLFSLTARQRGLIAATDADVPVARLQRQLQSGESNRREVQNFMAQDQMVTQFASLWLEATYPEVELVGVQYRVGRRVVPDFDERDVATVRGTDFGYFNIGWRKATRPDPAARAAFADYVDGVVP